MDPVRTIVTLLLPARSEATRSLLKLLVESGGSVHGAETMALRAGFRNRHQMRRALIAEQLPPATEIAGWIRVLRWSIDWETAGQTPSASALHKGLDPATHYRTVLKITGAHWTDVKQHGPGWVTLKLLERCHGRGGGGRPHRREERCPGGGGVNRHLRTRAGEDTVPVIENHYRMFQMRR
ncbi:MAG TPA: hypothetical protein VGA37_04870 [Gemmatimonadales bacterium]